MKRLTDEQLCLLNEVLDGNGLVGACAERAYRDGERPTLREVVAAASRGSGAPLFAARYGEDARRAADAVSEADDPVGSLRVIDVGVGADRGSLCLVDPGGSAYVVFRDVRPAGEEDDEDGGDPERLSPDEASRQLDAAVYVEHAARLVGTGDITLTGSGAGAVKALCATYAQHGEVSRCVTFGPHDLPAAFRKLYGEGLLERCRDRVTCYFAEGAAIDQAIFRVAAQVRLVRTASAGTTLAALLGDDLAFGSRASDAPEPAGAPVPAGPPSGGRTFRFDDDLLESILAALASIDGIAWYDPSAWRATGRSPLAVDALGIERHAAGVTGRLGQLREMTDASRREILRAFDQARHADDACARRLRAVDGEFERLAQELRDAWSW